MRVREALNALVWLRVGDQADARIARPVREALGSIDEALGLHAAHCRAYDLGLIYGVEVSEDKDVVAMKQPGGFVGIVVVVMYWHPGVARHVARHL